MKDYRNQTTYETVGGTSTSQINEGLRSHMLAVYNHMLVGLLLTAAISYAMSLMVIDPSGNLTGLGNALFNTPLKWIILFAPLGMVFFLGFRVHKMSAPAAKLTFYIYATLNGLALTPIGLIYAGETIASAFMITAVTFGAMSLWGYTTKRDLTAFGSFLFMALIGIIIASIVNIFIGSSMMGFIISCLSVLIFTGLTAYDTQKIRDFYFEVQGDETRMGRAAILGALTLYLDFINIFLNLLHLLGGNRD